MKANKTPSIRLKDYQGDWQEHTYSDYYSRYDERNKGQFPVERTLSVATMSINKNGNGASNSSLGNYKVLRIGDIAFEGHRNKEHRYGRFILNDNIDGIISPRFTALRPVAEQDYSFWKYYIHDENVMRKKLVKCTKAGTMMNELEIDSFLSQTVYVPEIAEQSDVGAYLQHLDGLILLHHQKHQKLSQAKLSFLRSSFANLDDAVPLSRFGGFTAEWKKQTLDKIIKPYTDYLPTPTDGYTRLGIRSHMKGTFYEYVAPSKQLGEKRLQRVKRDNFIVNIVFAWEHAIAVTTEEDEGKLVSHRFPQFSFNEGMYPRFFHYALNDERFRHHLWLASPSGAGRNKTLRIDEMMEYELRVPEYEEQKKIADFLTSLDELIELYDYRITKLQNIKAACLQGMFV